MALQTCPHKCRHCPFCICFEFEDWNIADDAEIERMVRLRILQCPPTKETYKCYKPQSAECLLNHDITKKDYDDACKINSFLITNFPEVWIEQHVDIFACWGMSLEAVKDNLDSELDESIPKGPNRKLWQEIYKRLYKRLIGVDYANA